MSEPSAKVLKLAGFLIGKAKLDNHALSKSWQTREGFHTLNQLLYISYIHHLLKHPGSPLFPDPIRAVAEGVIIIDFEWASRVIPWIDVDVSMIEGFPFDEKSYIEYLWKPFAHLSSDAEEPSAFQQRLEKLGKDEKIGITANQQKRLQHEMSFLKILISFQEEKPKVLPKQIEWWFDTPDHPFEKYLEDRFQKSFGVGSHM